MREYVREQEKEEGSLWERAEGEKPLSDSQLVALHRMVDKMIAGVVAQSRKKLIRRHLPQRRNLTQGGLAG